MKRSVEDVWLPEDCRSQQREGLKFGQSTNLKVRDHRNPSSERRLVGSKSLMSKQMSGKSHVRNGR
jgi:hypothetical protein